MKKPRTHYDNLQVVEHASAEVIKGAYRYLSQKWHPDKNPDRRDEAERITKILNKGYFVLSDPERRKQYDDSLRDQRAQRSFPPLPPLIDFTGLWARINAIQPPGPPPTIDPASLTDRQEKPRRSKPLLGLGGWKRRKQLEYRLAVKFARMELDKCLSQWRSAIGDDRFLRKQKELSRAMEDYKCIQDRYAEDARKLEAQVFYRNRQRFLSDYRIGDARIPGLGQSEIAELARAGIHTAADIIAYASIDGIGTEAAHELGKWRSDLAARFNPAFELDATDILWLYEQYAYLQSSIECTLMGGAEALEQMRDEMLRDRERLRSEIEAAASAYANAQANLSVFK